MKKYAFVAAELINNVGAIRNKNEIIHLILNTINYINSMSINSESAEVSAADIIIKIDKMSRIFICEKDKIHSFQFPFSIRDEGKTIWVKYDERVIDNMTVSILYSIFENSEKIYESLENMFDVFMDTMNDYEIKDVDYANFCWKLVCYFVLFEPGYLRYDHDEDPERVDAEYHPVDHIDFFFSGNNTFKLGLNYRMTIEELENIVDTTQKSSFIKKL